MYEKNAITKKPPKTTVSGHDQKLMIENDTVMTENGQMGKGSRKTIILPTI